LLQNDGDIIRGLGFTTLYAAYLEKQIDHLLTLLAPVDSNDKNKQLWPISSKIKHAEKILKRLEGQEIADLANNLRTCLELFENRNELVHGRIYAGYNRTDFDTRYTLQPGRPNKPEREVTPEELYQLANEFDDFRIAIHRPMMFKVPRAVAKYLERAV